MDKKGASVIRIYVIRVYIIRVYAINVMLWITFANYNTIDYMMDMGETDSGLQAVIYDQLEQLHEALGIQRKVVNSIADIAAFRIGHQVGLTLQQEHELLKIDSELDRLAFMQEHLERIIPIVQETERLKARAKLNGHYKNVLPPKYYKR